MKKNLKRALAGFSLMLLMAQGCVSLRGFQPPPADFERWDNSEEARRALLECGSPDPFDMGYSTGGGRYRLSDNEVALVERCMVSAGFKLKKRNSYSNYMCHFHPELEACKKDAVIPVRDKSRRLNGPYCTHSLYSTYPACRP